MTNECNRDNMELFVEALFSSSYEQGKASLRTEHPDLPDKYQYCCLGVATEVAIKAGIPEETKVDEYGDPYVDNVWENGYLPSSVREWLGIDSDNPLLDFLHGNTLRAASANDEYEQSFFQIGAAFRRTYLTSDIRSAEVAGD